MFAQKSLCLIFIYMRGFVFQMHFMLCNGDRSEKAFLTLQKQNFLKKQYNIPLQETSK